MGPELCGVSLVQQDQLGLTSVGFRPGDADYGRAGTMDERHREASSFLGDLVAATPTNLESEKRRPTVLTFPK